MQQITEASLSYYVRSQCAEQWRVFLTELAEELGERMELAECRQLMYALGRRMGRRLVLQSAETLAQFQAAADALWSALDWGYVSVHEQDNYIALVHHCAPLRAAFGDAALAWTPALLEGVYAEWFAAFGAGDDLVLQQSGVAQGGDDAIEYRLGRPDALANGD